MSTRHDLRNVAIIAHVDHGKTTLVDALLRQSGAIAEHGEVVDRVLDSGDLEREKGITILAKNISVVFGDVTVNIIDTPGHADFGGEVERGLAMVDGAILLVDAAEGPLPQTRFVLRKALESRLPIIVVVNKVDRPDSRAKAVLDDIYELFMDLGAGDEQIEFPVVYACARQGWATLSAPEGNGPMEKPDDVGPVGLKVLFDIIMERIPAPEYEDGHPLQALVTNIDASPYLGRLAICRVMQGELRKGQQVAWCRRDGTMQNTKITELLAARGLERVAVESVGPGDIATVAGMDEITIGETLADTANPVALPLLTVDEPTLSMTFGVNTSPLVGGAGGATAGEAGKKLTARQLEARLRAELIGNVSIRVLPTDRPDAFEVQGRGELALAVLVEIMRREGFELTIGTPTVITQNINGKRCEPVERLDLDVPEEYLGAVTQVLAPRRGQLEDVINHGTGWIRMIFSVPARGMIGIRTQLLSATRGTAQIHHAFDRFEPWLGEFRGTPRGAMIADRTGVAAEYALFTLEERGTLYIGPGDAVYEGMVIGEASRPGDMDVNPCRERKLTNIRSANAEELVRLTPPKRLSLEMALEMIAEDECVEVTPGAVRVRKVVLTKADRVRSKRVSGRSSAAGDDRADDSGNEPQGDDDYEGELEQVI